MRNRFLIPCAVLVLLLVTGCGAINSVARQLTGAAFTDAKLSDLLLTGVSGQFVALDTPQADGIPELAPINIGEIGVLLPVFEVGAVSPRWILCLDEMVAVCKKIPPNAQVRVTGSPIGQSVMLRPSRITCTTCED